MPVIETTKVDLKRDGQEDQDDHESGSTAPSPPRNGKYSSNNPHDATVAAEHTASN